MYRGRQTRLDRASDAATKKEKDDASDTRKRDPKFWMDTEYRAKYGDRGGKSPAWGKAMEHRGRSLKPSDASAQAKTLASRGLAMPVSVGGDEAIGAALARVPAGITIDNVGGLIDHYRGTGLDPVDRATTAQLRASATMLGHHRAIEPSDVVIPKGRRAGKDRPSDARRAVAIATAAAFFGAMADKSVEQPTGHEHVWNGKRATHRPKPPRLEHTGDAASLVHVWGHAIESMSDEARARALEVVDRRTHGKLTRTLRDVTGNPFYRADEMAADGADFPHAYMGKDSSPHTTELTAMLAELLATGFGPYLVDRDPDLFFFVMGALAGDQSS